MTPSPTAPSSDNDWRLLLRLLPYVKRYPKELTAALILLVPVAFSGAVQPLIIGQAVSLLREEPAWGFLDAMPLQQALNTLVIILAITIVVRLLFLGIQGFIVQKMGQEITADVRQDLFEHVTSLSVNFFHRTPVGRLVTRITSDVEALGEVFASGAIGVVSDIVSILAIIVTIFWVQWQLASILVAMLVPVTGLIIYFQQQYRKANYQAREELSRLNSQLQENVAGINVVQLFRREELNSRSFRRVNEKYRRAVDKTIFHDSAVSATLEWISLVAIAGVLALGGWLILGNNLEFGVLAAFILYGQRLFNPLRQFADKFTMFQSGFTAIERIGELMEEPVEIKDQAVITPIEINSALRGNHGEICFENVWFGYKPDEYVLKNLNFTIKPGEKVALVGPTGAGKSSIIRLLCRLHDPSQGRILVDGIDIRELSQQQLRRFIGVILQDSFLFAGDVKRNITLGEEYSLEEVQRAAQLTSVDRLIEELPQGYHTQLRERGSNLSGGQKQLLAFARVAIREPYVLVMDEATASLDVRTEADIQAALLHLLQDRTSIIIAHRLSTIRNVDRIFVLKHGEIVETGNHDQLLDLKGLYASLYQLQMLGS
ncbi:MULTISPECIES: ABC transporter ATP-binding protein [unclassified Synechocystis]|uniref:ABC transporter ATP-binding protein n=1 Tax=unclassified Synechocystis TaxID=2640012 RepID=UPI0003F7A8D1|nr:MULTISPECIES: ABC transporter ATP-binding protein [unclassified Synechocystis]AIE75954.1 Lipid A export ATP-binding/permease protein MsbA [Synechocystis sp. PCC 6714]MCT0255131.1 ABC transporter ATP-binding protein/permease [Synechocystis sp. CS-94]